MTNQWQSGGYNPGIGLGLRLEDFASTTVSGGAGTIRAGRSFGFHPGLSFEANPSKLNESTELSGSSIAKATDEISFNTPIQYGGGDLNTQLRQVARIIGGSHPSSRDPQGHGKLLDQGRHVCFVSKGIGGKIDGSYSTNLESPAD